MINNDYVPAAPITAKQAWEDSIKRQEEIKYEKLSECFQEIKKAINKGELAARIRIPEFIYNFITNKLIEYGYTYTIYPSFKEISSVILNINWEKPKED